MTLPLHPLDAVTRVTRCFTLPSAAQPVNPLPMSAPARPVCWDQTVTTPPDRRARTLQRVLLLGGLLLLSLNLRPAAVSVGPVLEELRDGLDMGPASAGLLTSLPVLAFAVFGALAPAAAARLGPHRVTFLALLAVVVGLSGRAVVHHEASFLALSLVAVAGMAMANVLIPSLVRLHFPDRIGLVTALYTTALAVGLTASFLLTVPVADAFGGWRYGIGIWAVLAAVAALPWLGLVRHDQQIDAPVRDVGYRDIARTRLGWAMTLFFGLQSLNAYAVFGWFATLWRDAGFGAGHGQRPGRDRRRDVDPALAVGAPGRGPARRPALGARAGHELLPGRLPRPDRRPARARGAVGGGPRRRAGDLPDRADPGSGCAPGPPAPPPRSPAGRSRPAT